jgi:16S rRNA (adenine1518-N6/adenine1519-N6)-dimethyltransferase
MNLEPLHVPELLQRFDLRPQKSLGQNFLVDHNALLKIVRDAGVTEGEAVLEIGAGLGSLTRVLAVQAGRVVAVEIDPDLFPALQWVTRPFEHVRLIQGDILNLAPESLFPEGQYLVVANIPYYITSAVIRHLLEAEMKPSRVVLTIQKEVAERIVNRDEKMSLLSLSVQVYGEARITTALPAECFYPRPKVDSSVLRIDVYDEPKLPDHALRLLFRLAHSAFNQKRKMLRNSLKPVLGGDTDQLSALLIKAGVDPKWRAEVLSLDDWIRLTETVSASK